MLRVFAVHQKKGFCLLRLFHPCLILLNRLRYKNIIRHLRYILGLYIWFDSFRVFVGNLEFGSLQFAIWTRLDHSRFLVQTVWINYFYLFGNLRRFDLDIENELNRLCLEFKNMPENFDFHQNFVFKSESRFLIKILLFC